MQITIKINRHAIGFTHFLKALGYDVTYGSFYAVNGFIFGRNTDEYFLVQGLFAHYQKSER
jgi:hypothetical protein